MVDDGRRIVIRIEGEIARDGRVPVSLLADKLNALQRLLYNVGSSFLGGGRRGSWKSEVLQACNLQFLGARSKCLEIVAELPVQPQLKIPVMDLGNRSIARLVDTLEAMQGRDREQLHRIFPDFGQRSRILKSSLAFLPEEDSDYSVCVSSARASLDLKSESRTFIKSLSKEETTEGFQGAIQTITGMLYLIEVATGQRHLGVKSGNRNINCYYPAEFEDTIRELIPGSLIEVEGFTTAIPGALMKRLQPSSSRRMFRKREVGNQRLPAKMLSGFFR